MDQVVQCLRPLKELSTAYLIVKTTWLYLFRHISPYFVNNGIANSADEKCPFLKRTSQLPVTSVVSSLSVPM